MITVVYSVHLLQDKFRFKTMTSINNEFGYSTVKILFWYNFYGFGQIFQKHLVKIGLIL